MCEDGSQDRVRVKGLALVGKFFEECSTPVVLGQMGTTQNVFMVFSQVLAEGAPVWITLAVFANKLPGWKHFVAQLDEVGAALGIRGCKVMGIPVDGVRHMRMPTVAFDEALQ